METADFKKKFRQVLRKKEQIQIYKARYGEKYIYFVNYVNFC